MARLNLLFIMIADFVLAVAVAQFAERGSGLVVFAVALGALWLLPLAFAFWGWVKFWLMYHAYLKKRLTRYYLAEFHKSNFPRAQEFYDWDAYLTHVLAADDVDQPAKIKASFVCGEIATFKSTVPLTMGLAAVLALESAMGEYRP